MLNGKRSTFLFFLAAWLLVGGLACGGRSDSVAKGENLVLQVTPSSSTLVIGSSLKFQAVTPGGGGVIWSVLPPAAGVITADGTFRPAGPLGPCKISAVWDQDRRYTGSATLNILAAPPPAESTPNLAEGSGIQQHGGAFQNYCIAGETVAATTSRNGTLVVRHGFASNFP